MAEFPAASAGLNIQPVQPANPLDLANQQVQLQMGRQQMQLSALKLQQAQQDFQDEQDVRRVAQQSGGDVDKISQTLRMQNPRAAAKWDQEVASQRKSQAETDEINAKAAGAKLDLFQRRAQEVQDQQGWQSLMQDPSFKDFTKTLNPTFDAGQRDQIVQSLLPAKDAVEAHLKAVQAQQEKQKIDLEAQKGQRDQAEADQKKNELDMHIAAQVMSQVKDQPGHDAALQYLKAAGVSPNTINLYGSQYTPDVPAKAKGYLNAGEKLDDRQRAIEAFNANPALTAKYGPGELGYQKYEKSQDFQQQVTLENMRIGAESAARRESQTFTETNRRIDKANADKEKSEQAFNDIQDSADRMNAFLTQMAAGNKVDNAAFKQVMVNEINKMSGMKRSNSPEMNALGEAGSIADRIQGKLAGWGEGKSVPPAVASDARQLINLISQNAAAAKQRRFDTIDKYSQAPGATGSPSGTSGPKVGDVKTFPNGRKGKWDGKGWVAQ